LGAGIRDVGPHIAPPGQNSDLPTLQQFNAKSEEFDVRQATHALNYNSSTQIVGSDQNPG